jgi:hypothetical protein
MKERHESDMARTREIQKMDKHYHGTGGGPPPRYASCPGYEFVQCQY